MEFRIEPATRAHLNDVIGVLCCVLKHLLTVLQVQLVQTACVCVHIHRLVTHFCLLQVPQKVCVHRSTLYQTHTALWKSGFECFTHKRLNNVFLRRHVHEKKNSHKLCVRLYISKLYGLLLGL